MINNQKAKDIVVHYIERENHSILCHSKSDAVLNNSNNTTYFVLMGVTV